MRSLIFASPFFFALSLVACGGSGGGAATGGTGGGGSTDTGTTSDSTTSFAVYDAEGCLVGGVPAEGASCPQDAQCKYTGGRAGCATDPGLVATCADGAWSVYKPLMCSAPGAFSCDPVGTWKATTTGPYYDAESDYYPSMFDGWDTFLFDVIRDSDGLLRVNGDFAGDLSADGCQIKLSFSTDEDCTEIDGEQFCSWLEGSLTLDLAQNPVIGEVHMECWGECGDKGTAPLEAHKQP